MTKKTKSKPKASSKPVDQSFALAEELLRMASAIDDYTDLPGQTISAAWMLAAACRAAQEIGGMPAARRGRATEAAMEIFGRALVLSVDSLSAKRATKKRRKKGGRR